jgi:hypothetical protein
MSENPIEKWPDYYVQLSAGNITRSPKPEAVFPLLGVQENGGSGKRHFRWAIMISAANRLMNDVAVSLGFVRDERSFNVAVPGDLNVYVIVDNGPLRLFKEDGVDSEKLITYLDIAFIAPGALEVVQPTKCSGTGKSLVADLWNKNWELNYTGIGSSAFPDVKFPDNNAEDPDPSYIPTFSFTVKTMEKLSIHGADVALPKLELRFSVEKQTPVNDAEKNLWLGATIRVNDNILSCDKDECLFPISDLLFIHYVGNQLHIEAGLNKPFSFNYFASGAIRVTLPPQRLVIRFSNNQLGVYLFSGLPGQLRTIEIRLSVKIIMADAPTPGNSLRRLVPSASSVTIGDDASFAFTTVLFLEIPPEWDLGNNAIFVSSGNGRLLLNKDGLSKLKTAVRVEGGISRFTGLDFDISELLGPGYQASFSITPGIELVQASDLENLVVPVDMRVRFGEQGLTLRLGFTFDPLTFTLAGNRVYFKFPLASNHEYEQHLDLGVIAASFPNRQLPKPTTPPQDLSELKEKLLAPPTEGDCDGYFDFAKQEFVIKKPVGDFSGRGNPTIIMPGNLKDSDLRNRLIFELQPFDPDHWPKQIDDPVLLRINGSGISFNAKILTDREVLVKEQEDFIRPIKARPLAERNGVKSELVVIDNKIRAGAIFAQMEVPGLEDLIANVEIGLRKDAPGAPPQIYAGLELERAGNAPLAGFSIGCLQLAVNDLRMKMKWVMDTNDWDFSAFVDGTASLGKELTSIGGLDDLTDVKAISVRNLNLLKLNSGIGAIDFQLNRSVKFDCLDGMFGAEFTDLKLQWGEKFELSCESAALKFKQAGELDVNVEVGALKLVFSGRNSVKMATPNRLGLQVVVGEAVRFRGEVAWVDERGERYFAAAGTVAIEGLPEVTALLKIGTGTKDNGQIVPNVVLYAAADIEISVFPGVVTKNLGAGIGINNKLAHISDRPTADEILANIDRINPGRIEGWSFVKRDGFHLSIVGSAIIASSTGGNSVTNAYVASLVLSIDSHLNVIAAGKLWLSSSVDFVRAGENWNRPALVGAIAFAPRDRLITAAIESRPNPAIESNPQLAKILNQGHVKLSFMLSPSIVDYYLEDVSFGEDLFGVQMLYRGYFRVAVFRGAVLVKAGWSITGHYEKELSAGPGGFSFYGDVAVGLEYGGLLSSSGLMAYGMIDASVAFYVRAWIKIEFEFTVGCGRWKKTIGFSKTFTLDERRLDLGIHGAVAFNESGQVGFSGNISISVSICGYQLSISPSFSILPNVIDEVRGRVAEFEDRLEAAKESLTGDRAAPKSFSAKPAFSVKSFDAEATKEEEWLLYTAPVPGAEEEKYLLLVPKPNMKWFTPWRKLPKSPTDNPTFSGQVKKIEAVMGAESREIVMPWDLPDRPLEGDDRDRLQQIRSMFFESAITLNPDGTQPVSQAHPGVDSENGFFVVSDPRVESAARDLWTLDDQFRLPDYAPPIAFRSVEELMTVDIRAKDGDAFIDRLTSYEYFRQRAARVTRHQGDDLSADEKAAQNRAAIVAQMLEDLRVSAGEQQQFRGECPAGTLRSAIFIVPEDWDPEKVSFKITREGDEQARPINVDFPNENVLDYVRPLPIRQTFVADSTPEKGASGKRTGRVIVKLPVKFDEKFLKEKITSLHHFRIWRAFPWEGQPSLIADFVRPHLTYVQEKDHRRVLVVQPYLFTDEFKVEGNEFQTEGLQSGITQITYWLQEVGPDADPTMTGEMRSWPKVLLHIPKPDPFPVDLAMIFPVESLLMENGAPKGIFQLMSTAGETPSLAGIPKDPDKSTGDTRPLKAEDFEIWVEEFPLRLSGFYTGGGESKLPKDPGRSKDPRRLRPEKLYQARHGKFKVKVSSAGDTPDAAKECQDNVRGTGTFKIESSDFGRFRSGYGYRFFICPPKGTMLAPLGLYLTRKLPKVTRTDKNVSKASNNRRCTTDWETPPTVRVATHIEWIPQSAFEQRVNIKPYFAQWSDFAVAAIPADLSNENENGKLSNKIAIAWEFPSSNNGGVEILLKDADDSLLKYAVTCEVQDASVFRESIPDFSNQSAWRVRKIRSVDAKPIEAPSDPETMLKPESVAAQLLWIDEKDTSLKNPLLDDLRNRKQELEAQLGEKLWTYWIDFFTPANNWTTAVLAYVKSPLNINDEAVRLVKKQIFALQRFVLTGYKDEKNTPLEKLSLEEINRIQNELAAQLKKVDEASADSLQFSETEAEAAKVAFLDISLAKRCAAVIRRRLACADEIMAPDDNELPSRDDAAQEFLPSWKRYEGISKQFEEIGDPSKLPLTDWFMKNFPARRETWAPSRLKEAIDKFIALAHFTDGDQKRKEAAAGVVMQASGLTLALNYLERSLKDKGLKLLKRPHHQVSVGTSKSGERVSEASPIRALMPDGVRLDEQLNVSAGDSKISPEQAMVSYGNLLERLGFALDIAASDELEQVVSQQEVLDRINEAKLVDLFPESNPNGLERHHVVVLAPREPDSERAGAAPHSGPADHEQYVGYSFVKLAVIPAGFYYMITRDLTSLWPTNPNDTPRAHLQYLLKYFSLRNIGLDDPKSAIKRISQVAAPLRINDVDSALKSYVRVLLEPTGDLLTTVPSDGGRAHISWTVPDLKGHRYEAAMRYMSRYEPLIKWLSGKYQLIEANGVSYKRVPITRVIVDPRIEDSPERLPVSIYPHPRKVRFSFGLPPAGARSIYNNISAIRTGYKGYELSYVYEILDRKDDKDPLRLANILAQISSESDPDAKGPQLYREPIRANEVSRIRLFRHERLITLDDLPFFYRYGMDVRSQYKARIKTPKESDGQDTASETKTSAKEDLLFAERQPAFLAVKTAQVSDLGHSNYKMRIHLSRNLEHLSPSELKASPPALDVINGIPIGVMPDPAMGYHIYHKIETPSESNNTAGTEAAAKEANPIFIELGQLLMPWHTGYKLPDDNNKPLPYFRSTHAKLKLKDSKSEEWFEIHRFESNGPTGKSTVFYVDVKFALSDPALFNKSDCRYMQASRGGFISRARKIEAVPAIG